MSGNTSWQQNGNRVTLQVDRVSNNSSSATSGSLRLQLWATASPYAGGTISGYILGSYQFSQVLAPNQYYSSVTQTVTFTAPPDGTYYTTMTLEEYTASGWVIQDHVTYNTTNTWGPPAVGGGDGTPAVGVLQPYSFPDRGGVSFTTNGGSSPSAEIGYARIQPNAGSATPPGVAIFSYRSKGILVSEAGVPASPLIRDGRVYAEYNGLVDTGIAIANPNSQPVTITFHFTRSDGVDFGSSSTSIAANVYVLIDSSGFGCSAARLHE
jgi:hypothetical protein